MTPPLLERIEDRSARVAVLGQGYVGLVVAMRASEAGFSVVGLEVDQARVMSLSAGVSYIEDVPDAVLQEALECGYEATSHVPRLSGFDVAVVSVPTPLRDKLPDLSHIEDAARMLAPHVTPGCCVILESTTYPGTTEELFRSVLEAAPTGLRAGQDFHLAYSPERVDPGNAAFGLTNTPKIVSGIDDASLDVADAFFRAFIEKTVRVSGTREAELAKIIENTFRHVNIALVNEIAMFAHELGVDVFEAIEAAATKPFGFMKFMPGPGVGGHCLPIDPTYLSWRVEQNLGESFRFVELANDVNEHMPHYVARRVQEMLNDATKPVRGSRLLLLGLAYKPGIGDARETPSFPLIRQLTKMGADLVVVDPLVNPATVAAELPDEVKLVSELSTELLQDADLVILVTDHEQFDFAMVGEAAARVLDTRKRLRGGSRAVVEGL